ncbi:MAG: hypothetical protein K0R98_1731 [Rickettsiaceae bacterium]|jgi:hypothetical protein|nr:hypothetical protein [Rickettsiaceae bacterium]
MKKLSRKQKARLVRLSKKHFFKYLKRVSVKNKIVLKTVMIPENLCFLRNKKKTLQFFEEFREKFIRPSSEERYLLDFCNLKYISQAASLVLLSEIDRAWKVNKKKIKTRKAKMLPIFSELREMGFFKLLNAYFKNNPYPNITDKKYIQFKANSGDVGEIIDQVRNAVCEESPEEISSEIRVKIHSALLESMNNVVAHAYSEKFNHVIKYPFLDRRWWISGYVDKSAKEVLVQFYDQGVGIPETIRPQLKEKFLQRLVSKVSNNESQAIVYATKKGVTTTGDKHRGKGLPQIIDAIKTTQKGQLHIMSHHGDVRVVYDNKSSKLKFYKKDSKISLRGTLIQWKVSAKEINEW